MLKNTGGNIPSNRDAFSAVLEPVEKQRIIIYGGRGINNISDALYVLDLNNWEWQIPTVTGNSPSVVTYSHRANVVANKYMVVSFGKIL